MPNYYIFLWLLQVHLYGIFVKALFLQFGKNTFNIKVLELVLNHQIILIKIKDHGEGKEIQSL